MQSQQHTATLYAPNKSIYFFLPCKDDHHTIQHHHHIHFSLMEKFWNRFSTIPSPVLIIYYIFSWHPEKKSFPSCDFVLTSKLLMIKHIYNRNSRENKKETTLTWLDSTFVFVILSIIDYRYPISHDITSSYNFFLCMLLLEPQQLF